MQTQTLVDYFHQNGIGRYLALAPFVQLDKVPFKSQVQGLSPCVKWDFENWPDMVVLSLELFA